MNKAAIIPASLILFFSAGASLLPPAIAAGLHIPRQDEIGVRNHLRTEKIAGSHHQTKAMALLSQVALGHDDAPEARRTTAVKSGAEDLQQQSEHRGLLDDGCEDSPFKFNLKHRRNSKKFRNSCEWVAKKLKKRCSMKGVSLMCANTCDKCSKFKESTLKFQFYDNDNVLRKGTCKRIAKKKEKHCQVPGMHDTCPVTCASTNIFSSSWNQVGADIVGEFPRDESGSNIAMSSDGSVLAIGAVGHGGTGHIRVFKNVDGSWVQVGNDLDGETGDYFGANIALSSDGNILAAGCKRSGDQQLVYENINGSWIQVGTDINFCGHIALSSDGTVLAVSNENGIGQVRVFKNMNGSWVQSGKEIDGEKSSDNFGFSIALSSDGNVLTVGAPGHDANGRGSGQVRVYKNSNGSWVQVGSDINGENERENAGRNVALSSDGSVLAVGAALFNFTGYTETGFVRVHQNVGGSWVQIGEDIIGEDGDDDVSHFGWRIELSSDGSVLAVADHYASNNNGLFAGLVRVYENGNGSWVQVGGDIEGENAGDGAGEGLAMSSDGSVLAVGAPLNNRVSGQVRVFQLEKN